MPTIKAFSVARTQKSYDPATPTGPSGVYSYSGVPEEGLQWSGRNGAYDHPTEQGAEEGRVPTLVVSGQTTAQMAAPLADGAAGPATGVTLTTTPIPAAAFPVAWDQGTYVVTTTNTGADHSGAGLIVRVDVAANGNMTLNAAPIVDAGEGYTTATDDTATLDLGLINPAQGAITIAA